MRAADLRDTQLFGRPRKADVPGGGLEGLERIELWQVEVHDRSQQRESVPGPQSRCFH